MFLNVPLITIDVSSQQKCFVTSRHFPAVFSHDITWRFPDTLQEAWQEKFPKMSGAPDSRHFAISCTHHVHTSENKSTNVNSYNTLPQDHWGPVFTSRYLQDSAHSRASLRKNKLIPWLISKEDQFISKRLSSFAELPLVQQHHDFYPRWLVSQHRTLTQANTAWRNHICLHVHTRPDSDLPYE